MKKLIMLVLGIVMLMSMGVSAGWLDSNADSELRINSMIDARNATNEMNHRNNVQDGMVKLLHTMEKRYQADQTAKNQRTLTRQIVAEINAENDLATKAALQAEQLAQLVKDGDVARAEKEQATQYAYLSKLVQGMIDKNQSFE